MARCEETVITPCGCTFRNDVLYAVDIGNGSGASTDNPVRVGLTDGFGGTHLYTKPGSWISLPEDGPVSTSNSFPADNLWLVPIILGVPFQDVATPYGYRVTDVAVNVATAATSGTIRAGIYSNIDNPVLVEDFGTPTSGGSLSTTGVKQWTTSGTAMHIRSYETAYIAIAVYSVTGSVFFTQRQTWAPGVLFVNTPTTLSTIGTGYRISGYTPGALPGTVSNASRVTSGGPAIQIKIAYAS